MKISQLCNFKKLSKKIRKLDELRKCYLPCRFSQKSFSFQLTRKDWKIIRKYVSTINLYLTNRCNSFCKVCFKNSSPFDNSQDLTLDEISIILKRIGKRKRIVLMGGEPTVREDVFDIIKLIRKSGNFPELYTNGLKLADISYVKKLKNAGIKQIILSFDGFSPNIYEKMRGGKHELFLKMLALKNLNAEKMLTFISATIAKGINEKEIGKLLKFCISSVKNEGSIRGIFFYAATRHGRWLIENGCEMNTLELIEEMEKTRLGIRFEYLVEMKKLLLNLSKFLYKLNFPIPFASGGLVGIYQVGSLKELIPLKKLKKINKKLKILFPFLLHKSNLLRLVLKPYEELLKSRLLIIAVGNVLSPNHFSPIFLNSIGLESKDGVFITNKYTAYALETDSSNDT